MRVEERETLAEQIANEASKELWVLGLTSASPGVVSGIRMVISSCAAKSLKDSDDRIAALEKALLAQSWQYDGEPHFSGRCLGEGCPPHCCQARAVLCLRVVEGQREG